MLKNIIKFFQSLILERRKVRPQSDMSSTVYLSSAGSGIIAGIPGTDSKTCGLCWNAIYYIQ